MSIVELIDKNQLVLSSESASFFTFPLYPHSALSAQSVAVEYLVLRRRQFSVTTGFRSSSAANEVRLHAATLARLPASQCPVHVHAYSLLIQLLIGVVDWNILQLFQRLVCKKSDSAYIREVNAAEAHNFGALSTGQFSFLISLDALAFATLLCGKELSCFIFFLFESYGSTLICMSAN